MSLPSTAKTAKKANAHHAVAGRGLSLLGRSGRLFGTEVWMTTVQTIKREDRAIRKWVPAVTEAAVAFERP